MAGRRLPTRLHGARRRQPYDYRDKIADYPATGIPLSLIVDTGRGIAQIHSEPDATAYRKTRTYDFGQDVPVGRWLLSTDNLPRYR